MVPGGEPAPAPPPLEGERTSGVTQAMRLQILSTEHWSLLASRSLAWNESFTRAGMFLSTLSGAIVALALVAQASDFGDGFRLFGLVILPVVLIVGIGTNLRMGMSNYHDAQTVAGMNRIRGAYVAMAPDLEEVFVMGTTEDERGTLLTMAIPPQSSTLVMMLASTPLLVSIVNSVLVGAILALLVMQLGGNVAVALLVAAVGFVASNLAWLWYGAREIRKARTGHHATPAPVGRFAGTPATAPADGDDPMEGERL